MQTQGGAAADAAIASTERYFDNQVKVDWLRNGAFAHSMSDLSPYVASVSTNRTMNGSIPTEVSGVDSTASAELTVVLGGADVIGTDQSLIEAFSDFNSESPLASVTNLGSEIKWSIGVQTPSGTTWYPQFVGNIRTIALDRESGEVTITALDRVELLRAPVHLPAWAVLASQANLGHINGQTVNASGVIDMCLRQCDVSPTPYRMPEFKEIAGVEDSADARGGLHLYVTGTGSALNAAGWANPGGVQPWVWDQEGTGIPMYKTVAGGKHPLAPADAPDITVIAGKGYVAPNFSAIVSSSPDRFKIPEYAGGFFFGFTLNTNDTAWRSQTADRSDILEVVLMEYDNFGLLIKSGSIYPFFRNGDSQWTGTPITPPVNTGLVRLNFGIDMSSTGLRFFAAKDGDPHTWSSPQSWNHSSQEWGNSFGVILVTDALSISDFYLFSANWDNPPADHSAQNIRATYPAALDQGEIWMSNFPDTSGSDAWTIITDVANTDHGAVFWDETGVFRYWNYSHIRALRERPVKTITLDELSSLGTTSSLDNIRNTLSLAEKNVKAVDGVIFESDSVDDFYVTGQTTKEFRFPIGDEVINVGWDSPLISAQSTWDTDVKDMTLSHASFSYLKSDSWTDDQGYDTGASDPIIQSWLDGDRNLVIRVRNTSNYPIRFASAENVPTFKLLGTVRKDYGDKNYSAHEWDSVHKYGYRNIDVSGDWYQIWPQYSQWTDTLLRILAVPTPSTDSITVQGDPRVQLGDCMYVKDPDGIGEKFAIQVTGIDRSMSLDEGLTDTYTVEVFDVPDGLTWGGVVNTYDNYTDIPFTTWQALIDYVPST